MKKIIKGILFGPTNVGKTSLLERMETMNGVTEISIGKLTREGFINTEIKRRLQDCVRNKVPVPPEIAVGAIMPSIDCMDRLNRSYFLDGVPRTREEATMLIQRYNERHHLPNIVIHLTAEFRILSERILIRLEDQDRVEDFRNYQIRLDQYYKESAAIMRFLMNYIPVIEIDTSDKSIEETHTKVLEAYKHVL